MKTKKFHFYLLFGLIFLVMISNCAMIPELNQYRINDIAKGPDFEPYSGLKKRIAVLDFENLSEVGDDGMGSAISDMLVSQLSRSGRFILVERSRIDEILKEQAYGQSGIIAEGSEAKVGKLLGVESIITGKIIRAGQETGSQKIDNKKDKWNLALKATVGFTTVTYRVISTETGEILMADQVSTREIRPGFGLKTKEYDFSNLYDFDETIVGIAFRKAINKMAVDIVKSAGKIEWRGKVVQVKSDTLLYFTPGSGAGLQMGQVFNIYDNPANKENAEEEIELAHINRPKARVKIIGFIGDKVSRARILMGNMIQRGDLVKFFKPPKKIKPLKSPEKEIL